MKTLVFVFGLVGGWNWLAVGLDPCWAMSPTQEVEAFLVQVPFAEPPPVEIPELPKATPPPQEFTEKDRQRAEALLPLLSGPKELYAMGEFVHLGKLVVPVLVKALKMPDPRLRYNAIETLKIIDDPQAVPFLLEVARDTREMTRVRAHALRVAVRLDPIGALPALQALVHDPSDTIRRTVAFEARYIKKSKEVPFLLIELLGDPKRYVSVTALESFWLLTRYVGKPHNWQGSTQEERKQWAQEWRAWWKSRLQEMEQDSSSPSEPISSVYWGYPMWS
ncbi:MAG: HEAT repeat domain-containing protein [Nitrospirae bacterium]|nr:MAG: HEAT repeat domain-containing protein [Nitrospirota bacterium]